MYDPALNPLQIFEDIERDYEPKAKTSPQAPSQEDSEGLPRYSTSSEASFSFWWKRRTESFRDTF